MFTISEGFTTGIARYTPNKYQLLNNTVVDATIAEYAGKGTSMNTEDASIECTRKECDVFVRKEQDGETIYYKMTALPYDVDNYQDQTVGKEKIDIHFMDKPKESLIVNKAEVEPTIYVPETKKGNSNSNSNIIIIILFILLIGIVIYFGTHKKKTPLYEHRPYMADESGVLV